MAVDITIADDDDRPEQMVRDPDGYFAAARQRANGNSRARGTACSPRCAASTTVSPPAS